MRRLSKLGAVIVPALLLTACNTHGTVEIERVEPSKSLEANKAISLDTEPEQEVSIYGSPGERVTVKYSEPHPELDGYIMEFDMRLENGKTVTCISHEETAMSCDWESLREDTESDS